MRSASSVVHRRIRAAMQASRRHDDLNGSPEGHGKVLDWRTPGLSGLALCLALRRRWPMIPIVVVTSSDEVRDDDQPANAWLQKPIDPPLLNRVIHNELAPVRSA
jgi:DNA-binding response OmpR family regulator